MLPPAGPHPSALLPRFPPQPDWTRSMHGLRARPPPLTAQLSCAMLRTRAAPPHTPTQNRSLGPHVRAFIAAYLAPQVSIGSVRCTPRSALRTCALHRRSSAPELICVPSPSRHARPTTAARAPTARARAALHPRSLSLSRARALCRRSRRTHSCAAPVSLGRSPAHPSVSLHMSASLSSDVPQQCAARLAHVPKPLDSRAHRAISVFSHHPCRPRPWLLRVAPLAGKLRPLISSVSVTDVLPGLHHHACL
jgi:hypothetical protein